MKQGIQDLAQSAVCFLSFWFFGGRCAGVLGQRFKGAVGRLAAVLTIYMAYYRTGVGENTHPPH